MSPERAATAEYYPNAIDEIIAESKIVILM